MFIKRIASSKTERGTVVVGSNDLFGGSLPLKHSKIHRYYNRQKEHRDIDE
jgi:hypothetical protein